MEWVNSIRGPNLTIFFQYITWLGYKDFLFLFVPFCYWFFDRKIFSTFTLFVFISALINAFLKDFFQDPRPENIESIDPFLVSLDPSYGFPSGHAQLAVVIWGFILLRSKNNFIKILCLFLIASISFSRIYLGVHDIADVISGIIFGIVSLILLEQLLSNKGEWLRELNKTWHFLTYLIFFALAHAAWPLEENNLVALALGALVIGFWLGKIMDEKYFNFQNPDNIVLKITFVGLAIVGFIQLNVYVENLFNIINIGHNIEAIISSLLLGFYISFIAPFILYFISLQTKQLN
ncbi:phosphatase PAP2 family protein [Pelagibacterales bacterium]|nr:phosphatase PAP2 family protein [Pelagibacterales bacterium]